MTCAPGLLCVFLSRGDCASYVCAATPAGCASDPTCNCLGDSFCAGFIMSPDETMKCLPEQNWLPPGTIDCQSNILCV
jgi:hypothetical protein